MAFPKIELYRAGLGRPLLYPDDPHIIAIAVDRPLAHTVPVPTLDLNSPATIGEFVLRHPVIGLRDDLR